MLLLVARCCNSFRRRVGAKKIPGTGSQKIVVISLAQSQKDLILIEELLESGQVVPVIDGCYPLSKTAEAFRYFENEHPKGKVVIRVLLISFLPKEETWITFLMVIVVCFVVPAPSCWRQKPENWKGI